jgi:hypothetical protein
MHRDEIAHMVIFMVVDRRLMLRRAGQVALICGVSAVTARSSAMPTAAPPAPPRPAAPPVAWVVDRPSIVARADWDTSGNRAHLPPPQYASTVKAVFVHHTDSGNDYDPEDVPSIISNIDGDQTGRRGWDDIGYNFLVDRFGTVYEGRNGGVDRAVVGAHTSGFNLGSVGVAAIGTFEEGTAVPAPMLGAIARLVAWKLSLYGVDPRSSAALTCSNSLSRFTAGSRAVLPAVSGHRDADCTFCPGAGLYAALPAVRTQAARIQLATRHGVLGPAAPVRTPGSA